MYRMGGFDRAYAGGCTTSAMGGPRGHMHLWGTYERGPLAQRPNKLYDAMDWGVSPG